MTDRADDRATVAVRALSWAPPPPAPAGVLRLDANECPWSLVPDEPDALAAVLARVPLHRYPDPRATRLRHAIAARFGGDPGDYVVGAGSDEIVAMLLTAFAAPRPDGRPPAILFPTPTFVMYGVNAAVRGIETVGVPLDADLGLDGPAMRLALGESDPNLVFLASPNNPTGGAFQNDLMLRLAADYPRTVFVLDEAYAAFARAPLPIDAAVPPNVVRTGTLSKVGLAGARVGWARVPPPFRPLLERVRLPFNVPAPSQAIAAWVLEDRYDGILENARRIVRERERLGAALAELSFLRCRPSDANFFYVEPGPPWTPATLGAALLEHGVAVRALPGALRITIGTPDENDALLAVMGRLGQRP